MSLSALSLWGRFGPAPPSLEGFAKAAVFPVFYEDSLENILWCLDYDEIKASVDAQQNKKAKLSWLLENHGPLPDQEIADMVGYTRVAVIRARSRSLLADKARVSRTNVAF